MDGPQFLVDSKGNRIAVVLDIPSYNALIEQLEDYEDTEWARDYTERKAAGLLTPDELDVIPFEQAMAEIDAERAVAELKVA